MRGVNAADAYYWQSCTFVCRLSKGIGSLNVLEPLLGLYSDSFTFT